MNSYNHSIPSPNADGETHNPRSMTLRHLNHLLGMIADAQKGFETVKTKVQDETLRELFEQMAQMHARHYGKLCEVVDYFEDEKPRDRGTTAGQMHRAWIDFKSKLSDNHDAMILEAVRFGVQQLDHAYATTLRESTFLQNRQAYHERVTEQHEEVQDALEKIDALCETYRQ